MLVLGIETSCDECSIAVVEGSRTIRGQVIATQIEEHAPYNGVVPEIASRTHTRWISGVYVETLRRAAITADQLDGVAVANRPGLVGSLAVGTSFGKALAYGLSVPIVGVDHVRAHLYAPQLEREIPYPFLGVLVSGGHTIIATVHDPFEITVMGTTIDDACGEAFDKIAKHYAIGYPGGAAVDRLAREGDPFAYEFPDTSLHKGDHRYDVSYSGLKTAAINQLDQFKRTSRSTSVADIAASFQRAAVDILLRRVVRAAHDSGTRRVVLGGGVAANSYLRSVLGGHDELDVIFPPIELCTDNGAMIAGLGTLLLERGDRDGMDLDVSARVPAFRRGYP
jgi:N6-L-threonylcarbamoyladenine synthase